MKKNIVTRKTKEEKRRLAFEKRNVKKERNFARYGAENGSALIMVKSVDFSRRFIAAFLALVFAISSLVVGLNFVTKADDAEANLRPAETTDPESGMVLNKYLTPNSAGNYDLTLEAYTTADEVEINETIPTDFIIVADQSGSMSTTDMATDYSLADPAELETIANSSKGYYYKDGDNYYRVYPVKGYLYEYHKANSLWTGDLLDNSTADLSWFQEDEQAEFPVGSAYYVKDNGDYYPLVMSVKGLAGSYGFTLSYDKDGVNYPYRRPDKPVYRNWSGRRMESGLLYSAVNGILGIYDKKYYLYGEIEVLGINLGRTGMYVNIPLYSKHVGYTKLCYRDINGVEHTLPNDTSAPWEYCNHLGQALNSENGTRPTYSGLYTEKGSNISRLAALKEALKQFATEVANETDYYGAVDNKVSIVGFSSSGYNNTELLTGDNVTISSNNGVQKSTADSNEAYYYGTALVESTNGNAGTVNPKITDAINALTANGGTQPEDGLDMAYKILTNREETTYTLRSGLNKGTSVNRNQVVIFFTDGQPGDYPFSNMYKEANDVVGTAQLVKHNGAILFTIGVFGEADGNPLTYAAHKVNSRTDEYEYEPGWMETFDANYYSSSATEGYRYQYLNRNWLPNDVDNYGATPNDTIYDYMSVISSNYPNATQFMKVKTTDTPGAADINGYDSYLAMCNAVRGSEPAATNNYYRMASNQDTLITAFKQAVTMNNTGLDPTTIDMNGDTVLKDFINATDFAVSDSYTITYETEDITMTNGVVTTVADSRTSISGLTTDFTNNTLSVSGYDYTDHYVAEGRQGQKLIVTLHDVYPVSGKTSANNILYSNIDESGIYNANDKKVLAFPMPSITRHSYTVKADSESTASATFTIVDENGQQIDESYLTHVVIQKDNSRMPYSANALQNIAGTSEGYTVYIENLPAGAKVKSEVEYSAAAGYDATLSVKQGETDVSASTDNTYITPYAGGDVLIEVTSEPNFRTVTLAETVSGDYAIEGDTFDVTLTLTPPTGTDLSEGSATLDLGGGVTLGKNSADTAYEGTVNGLPGGGTATTLNQVPYGWTLVVTPVQHDRYDVAEGYPKYTTTEPDAAEAAYPATGLAITSGTTDIVIHNIAKNIPVTGISDDSNHNWIIYILAGIAILSAGAGAAYVYRRKRLTTER